MLVQKPCSIPAFSREGRTYPIGERRGYNAYRLCGCGFLADHQECFGTSAFPGRTKRLHLVDCGQIEIQMCNQRRDITGLLADDFRTSVLENSWSVSARLRFCADEIFNRLADPPNT